MKLDIYRFIAGLFESHLDSRVDSVEVQPWSEVHNVLFTSPSVQSQVQSVGQGAGAVLFNIILFFGFYSSGMEIYSKMQDPLSPSNKKIGGENVEFKSKCLKICQEAALFWLTDYWIFEHGHTRIIL